jgi:hypothetical protein
MKRIRRSVMALFTLASALVPLDAQAEVPPTKPFVVPSQRLNDQTMSDGFCIQDGRCFIVFYSGVNAQTGLKIRPFDANGRPISRDGQVVRQPLSLIQDRLAVHSFGRDKFVVQRVESPDYYNAGLTVSTYRIEKNNTITRLSETFTDYYNNTIIDDHGAMASLSPGFLSIFPGDITDNGKLLAQRFSATGVAIGKRYAVSQSLTGVSEPRIRRLSTGRFAVAWRSTPQIRLRILDATGKPAGPERGIAMPQGARASFPVLEPLSDGRFVIFYQEESTARGLKFVVFDGNGRVVRSGLVSALAEGDDSFENLFSVVRKRNGGFAVVYQYSTGYPNMIMAYKEFDRNLVAVRGETPVLVQKTPDIDYDGQKISIIQSGLKRGLISWGTDDSGFHDGSGRALLGISVPFK